MNFKINLTFYVILNLKACWYDICNSEFPSVTAINFYDMFMTMWVYSSSLIR